ncbi:MAG: FAD-dependent oxidoreductase [Verrucomicrobiales bacterium]|nr:FAD-dependent oxidoreductase [Verrucomicrobiales bacterium]
MSAKISLRTPRASTLGRRNFIRSLGTAGLGVGLGVLASPVSARSLFEAAARERGRREMTADILIVGGGLGGCAAALAALEAGKHVILTEETDWIGGQLTQQGVPPDENRWIETHGCTRTYRSLRNGIRDYYRRHFPLLPEVASRAHLNPGDGNVSRLCHEPKVALAVLESLLAPYQASRQLVILLEHHAIAAETQGDSVLGVTLRSQRSGGTVSVRAPYFIDATELGDLLPLARVEFVTGAEARRAHGELHAPEIAQPANQQAFTVCFAVDHVSGADHRIEKPREYPFWRSYLPQLTPPWPGPLLSLTYSHPVTLQPRTVGFSPISETTGDLLNLWRYRRIARQSQFKPGAYPGDISLINWPQNDYWLGNLVGVSDGEATRHVRRAKQLSLSLLYWLQTEVPRVDGGTGWPGLRLRGDLMGTEDGLAKYPYIRESRRIRAVYTVAETDCGRQARAQLTGASETAVKAKDYHDTVGIGHYNIDLHPSTQGVNYIDVPSLPFQIPLGALLPIRVKNLLPACKNLGATHITNGCYRLHPVEWNIGEAAGALAAFALDRREPVHAVREKPALLRDFQARLEQRGVELRWPAT